MKRRADGDIESAARKRKDPCENCAGGTSIKFSGMFLFEPKASCLAVHVPQVAAHEYMLADSGRLFNIERSDIWQISSDKPAAGDLSGLSCPAVDSFAGGIETTLRYCKIMLPLPCCVEPIEPEAVNIQGPVSTTGDSTIFHYFVFHYPAGAVLTATSDCGEKLMLREGACAVLHAEPMSKRAYDVHVPYAFKELSRMCRKSDTITVRTSAHTHGTGHHVAHCFSIKAS